MTLQEESEALQAAANAMLRRTGVNRAELTLSNGIVLTFRPVTPSLITAVREELESRYPAAPVTYLEAKGRDEPNPNDPAYQNELRRLMARTERVLNDLVVAAGVEIKSVPEGYFNLEDPGWLEDPRIVVACASGYSFDRDDAIQRKVTWLRYYAVETWLDDRLFNRVPIELAGITEAEVQSAVDAFRGLQGRGTDPDGAAAAESTNGAGANRAARRRGP
jgi:hypothetical protein